MGGMLFSIEEARSNTKKHFVCGKKLQTCIKAVGETIKEESLKGKSCCSVSFTYGQCSSEVRSALHQQLTEWRYKIFSYHCDDVDGGWCGYRFDVSLEV